MRRFDRDGYRPGDEVTTRIELDSLDESHARSLLQSAVGEQYLLRPDQVDALVERAGGNPLFIEQLAHAAVSGAGEAELSGSLESVVAAQIDTLPSQDRRALMYAAVLGPMFETSLLAELMTADGGDARGTARRLRTFVESASPGWLRFRNQVLREVAYETLSFRKRKELHRRAGDAIEAAASGAGSDRSEILSFHFLHAQEYGKCWHYSLIAAKRAEDKYANVEAVALYERALTAGSQLGEDVHPPVVEVLEWLGEVALSGGLYERARTAFARARAIGAGDPTRIARLCRKESLVAMHRGLGPTSVRWLNKGLKLLEGRDDGDSRYLRAEMQAQRAEQLQRVGNNREALRWAETAIAEADASGNRQALAVAYSVADLAQLNLGQPTDSSRLHRALEIWLEVEEPRRAAGVLTVLGAASHWKGDWELALDYFTQARDAFQASGDLVTAGYGSANIAEVLLDQGRGEEVSGLGEVINLWRSVGHPAPVPGALINVGRAALQRGDVMKAHDVFDQARWAAEDVGADTAEFDYWIAECMIREGDAASAVTLLEHAVRAESARGGSLFVGRLYRGLGYAHLGVGDHEAARTAFERAVDEGRSKASPFETAQALDGLVALADERHEAPPAAMVTERDATLERLGVRQLFRPVPSPTG